MELAMIGLGKMGLNMATRLVRGGHRVIGFARTAATVQSAVDNGAGGRALARRSSQANSKRHARGLDDGSRRSNHGQYDSDVVKFIIQRRYRY